MSSGRWAQPHQGLRVGGGLAFVFPGGGSQYVGMGRDVYERYESAKRVFDQADSILEFSLSKLCFEGPGEQLDDTVNAQPAMVVISTALLAALNERTGIEWTPDFFAGHSTGQYTALVSAGVLDFPSTLRLIRERGRLMKEAGDRKPGAMAAVLGLEAEALRGICAEVGEVWIANDNAPGQIVVSGTQPAVELAVRLAMERGAKRAIPLAVNIASHCPLMAPAAQPLAEMISGLPLSQARRPIIGNVSASALLKVEDLRRELVRHITSPVRWVDSVRYLVGHGVHTLVEIGPKGVLSGLIKRIDRDLRTVTVGTIVEIEALEAEG
jgi:[acyl-carrier-protein] S-malonyltransferase